MITPKRPHILYVDDDDDSCAMITMLLEVSKIDVTCVHGMDEALRMKDKDKFDVFLLDHWMHDGDGNQLCLKLRDEFPQIPVVFYTGSASQQEKRTGLMSGAAAYLVKPNSELIAPMIFWLLKGTRPRDAPANPFTVLAENAKTMGEVISGSNSFEPFSTYN